MITTCKSTGERTTEGQGKIDKLEIRGFTQFPVYTGRNFLGYIEADGQEKTFDKKLWRGKTKQFPSKKDTVANHILRLSTPLETQLLR